MLETKELIKQKYCNRECWTMLYRLTTSCFAQGNFKSVKANSLLIEYCLLFLPHILLSVTVCVLI